MSYVEWVCIYGLYVCLKWDNCFWGGVICVLLGLFLVLNGFSLYDFCTEIKWDDIGVFFWDL